ncbi:hypothetical protein GEMRC1_001230 [Eukaryota sp. GEM-RC1]
MSSHKFNANACLFVANIADPDESKIRTVFSKFGPILRIKVLAEKSQRTFYAFVEFEHGQFVDLALKEGKNIILDGRLLRTEAAQTNTTLFIARLNRSVSDDDLRTVFSQFGPLEKVTLIWDHVRNCHRGCGFLKFQFREDAIQALANIKKIKKPFIRNAVLEWASERTRSKDQKGSSVSNDAEDASSANNHRSFRRKNPEAPPIGCQSQTNLSYEPSSCPVETNSFEKKSASLLHQRSTPLLPTYHHPHYSTTTWDSDHQHHSSSSSSLLSFSLPKSSSELNVSSSVTALRPSASTPQLSSTASSSTDFLHSSSVSLFSSIIDSSTDSSSCNSDIDSLSLGLSSLAPSPFDDFDNKRL